MNSKNRRLLLAFFLSGSCFLTTFIWHRLQQTKIISTGTERIAQVTSASEDSKKRLSQSLHWLPLGTGDSLFDGDTIKTSDQSEVRISFEDGRTINVDSGSTIVIQKSKGDISLDLVEGSLYVDAQTQNPDNSNNKTDLKQQTIIFKSNDSNIALDGAKTLISKDKNNKTQLSLLSGQAKVLDGSGKVKEIQKGESVTVSSQGIKENIAIKIISPSQTSDEDKMTMLYYINPDGDSTVSFKWKGFPKNQEVVLLTGATKNSIKEKEVVPMNTNSINTLMTIGTHYWQLISRDPNSKQVLNNSPLYKLDVLGRYPAVVIAPENEKVFETETLPMNISLQWQKPSNHKSVHLEVSTHPQMLSQYMLVKNINVSQVQQYNLNELKEGTYYWRLSTKYEDSDKSIQTKIQKFVIKKLIKEAPKPPPILAWSNAPDQQFFLTQPSLQISWVAQTRKEDIVDWKVNILFENETPDKTLSFNTKLPAFKGTLKSAGKYTVEVEALDKNQVSIGKLTKKIFEVAEFPLPKAPRFSEGSNLKRNIATNRVYFENGMAQLKWDFQPIVKEYEIILTNPKGEQETYSNNQNFYSFKGITGIGLAPGAYTVSVTPIDQHNRRGPSSEPFSFEVPKNTNLSAPKLKNLKIDKIEDQ